VAELFIWVPGAYPEAPLVDPAKLGDETINIAVAAIIQVFFISGLLFGFDLNVGDTKKFSLLATLALWNSLAVGPRICMELYSSRRIFRVPLPLERGEPA